MAELRDTLRVRRQSWFGLKRHAKELLAAPAVHPVLRVATRLMPSSKVARLPAPAHLREVTGKVADVRFVMLDPGRCEIAKELYWGEGRRPRPEDALALDLITTLTGSADVFVDIGAYTGVFTVATTVAHPRLRAHAFEIVPAVKAALTANLRRNGVEDRVTVHHHGVGGPEQVMRVPSGEGGSALPSFYSPVMTFAAGQEVSFVALDTLLSELEPGERLVMKIDVEGGEAAVLGHGQELLARHRPDILCEVLPGVADVDRLHNLLAPHGYRYYLVTSDGVRPSDRLTADPDYRDWVLSPRSPSDLAAVGVPVTERT